MAASPNTPNLDDWDNLPLDPAADDDWDAPTPPPKAPAEPEPGLLDDFFGPSDGQSDDLDKAGPAAPAPDPSPDEGGSGVTGEGSLPNVGEPFDSLLSREDPGPATQKVELDIDGIFLETLESAAITPPEPEIEAPPAPEPDIPAPKAPEPAPAAAPPPEAGETAAGRKLAPAKLLILVLPALLVLILLSLGVYRLFIYQPPAPPPPLRIDPTVPFREPEPGDLALKPFFINFAGQPETIVEMSVVLYYNDAPDKELIESNLPVVREVIFNLTRGKGSQVVASGEIQRALRQELALAANSALGSEAISYVQLTQFRILH